MIMAAESRRLTNALDEGESVHGGHVHVRQNQTVWLPSLIISAELSEGLFSARHRRRPHLPAIQHPLKNSLIRGVVVHYQDAHAAQDFRRSCVPASTFSSEVAMRTVKWNWLPRPTSLSTQIRPPIMLTSREEIVSPRPVPPYCRVVELSACEKGSKMIFCFSTGMPIPVSETVKCRMRSAPLRHRSTLSGRLLPPT